MRLRQCYLLGVVVSAAMLLTIFSSPKSRGAASKVSLETPLDVYKAACASCHGLDGRGTAPTIVGFDIPLPDFTDCSFATREPIEDWFGIVHSGGPTRRFDRMMPAFGEALGEGEIEKALEHVQTFCPDKAWPRGELNLPRAIVTEKAYPEDEAVFHLGVTTEEPVAVNGKFIFEKRVGARHQFEAILPFGVKQMEREVNGEVDIQGWGEGAGDIALGWKTALVHSIVSGTIFSLAGEVIFPTGDEKDGFGKGTFIFEPFLALGQIIPEVGFIQFQGGAELSVDTDLASHEGFWRLALGRAFNQGRFGRAWTPIVEILGKTEFEDEASVEWDIVPELQVTLSRRQHIMASMGVRLPLTEFGPRPMEVMVYLLWDWFDGGFFEGW